MAGRGEVPEPGGCEQDAADTEAEEPAARQPERLPGPRGHRLNIPSGSCSCVAIHCNCLDTPDTPIKVYNIVTNKVDSTNRCEALKEVMSLKYV